MQNKPASYYSFSAYIRTGDNNNNNSHPASGNSSSTNKAVILNFYDDDKSQITNAKPICNILAISD